MQMYHMKIISKYQRLWITYSWIPKQRVTGVTRWYRQRHTIKSGFT